MAGYSRIIQKRLITKDLEDGEIMELTTTERFYEFNDGYDAQLMGDADDRARLQRLNELEREQELYKRCLRRENLQRKFDIQRQLNKDRENSKIKERSQTRRQNLDHQRAGNKKADAFERLMKMRNNKLREDRSSKDYTVLAGGRMGSQSQRIKKVKLKAADIYSDESSSSSGIEEDTPTQTATKDRSQVSTVEQLSRAVLTRNQLESFVDKPIFGRTVVGCFVRINVSGVGDHSNCVHQILAVKKSKTEYQLGNKRTKLNLRVRCGDKEEISKMNVVSNQPVTNKEFDEWVAACQRDMQALPLLSDITQKQLDVERASEYSFTEGDVEKLIQSKRDAGQKRVSAAYRKVCLIMERDSAVGMNDMERVKGLEKQIQEIDEQPRIQGETTHVVSSPCAPVPRHEPLAPATTYKRTYADRAPNSEEFELEQYMRRKYKKSAVVSRSRVEAGPEGGEEVVPMAEVPSTDATIETEEVPELDLYALHNFPVFIDLTGLPPLNFIFKDINLTGLSDG